MGPLSFHIYFKILSLTVLNSMQSVTHTRMHGQAQTNMPPQLLRSLGHNQRNKLLADSMGHILLRLRFWAASRPEGEIITGDYMAEVCLYLSLWHWIAILALY